MENNVESSLQELPSRYTNTEKLGAGGMGVVYKAHDSFLNKTVAIKMVIYSGLENESIARFQREAKLGSSLNHPNIVTILDFGIIGGGKPYMVMDYVEGKPLDRVLKEKRIMSVEEAVPIFVQIGRAMAHAHSRGVLHRDLKPSNILLTNLSGEIPIAKILDFGLAKALSTDDKRLTKVGAIIGSPLYLSPEQAKGWEADERSDIYSFGCLMYEALAGRPPIKGETAMETITLKTEQRPTELDDARFPAPLVRVVSRCLEIDPAERFGTFDEIVSELNKLLERRQPAKIGSVTESIFTTLHTLPRRTNAKVVVFAVTLVVFGASALTLVASTPFTSEVPDTPISATYSISSVKGKQSVGFNPFGEREDPLKDHGMQSLSPSIRKIMRARDREKLDKQEGKGKPVKASLWVDDSSSEVETKTEYQTRYQAYAVANVRDSDTDSKKRSAFKNYLRKHKYNFFVANELRNLALKVDAGEAMRCANLILENESKSEVYSEDRIAYCVRRTIRGGSPAQKLRHIIDKYPNLRHLKAACLTELAQHTEGDAGQKMFDEVEKIPGADLTKLKVRALKLKGEAMAAADAKCGTK